MLLVIVHNLDVGRPRRPVNPFEANSPLIVDANTVLAFAAPFKSFKPVTGQVCQVGKDGGGVKPVQLQARGTLIPENAFTRSPAANARVRFSR